MHFTQYSTALALIPKCAITFISLIAPETKTKLPVVSTTSNGKGPTPRDTKPVKSHRQESQARGGRTKPCKRSRETGDGCVKREKSDEGPAEGSLSLPLAPCIKRPRYHRQRRPLASHPIIGRPRAISQGGPLGGIASGPLAAAIQLR